jgi:hypothetical protein
MVERVNLEPTMEEIVVALRETRRGATGTQPYAVVSRPSAGNWTSGRAGRSDSPSDSANGEIERLLADNMRLNERVVFLLKVLERDQTSNSEFAAVQAALETERGALLRDVKAALGAELRPVLQVLLRLLEKQRAAPLEAAARRTGPEAASVPTPVAAAPDWIADPSRELGSQGESRPKKTGAATSLMPQQPKLRQRMARFLDASALLVPFFQATHLQTSVARWRPVGWQA